MSFATKLREEIRSVLIATLYFGCWILALMVIKWLVLAEYAIAFRGWSMALVGALVLAKVVLVLEHVSLGDWVRRQPAWVGVVLRTAFYTLGVALVLILEKGIRRPARGRWVRPGRAAPLSAGGHLPCVGQPHLHRRRPSGVQCDRGCATAPRQSRTIPDFSGAASRTTG